MSARVPEAMTWSRKGNYNRCKGLGQGRSWLFHRTPGKQDLSKASLKGGGAGDVKSVPADSPRFPLCTVYWFVGSGCTGACCTWSGGRLRVCSPIWGPAQLLTSCRHSSHCCPWLLLFYLENFTIHPIVRYLSRRIMILMHSRGQKRKQQTELGVR